MPPFEMGPFEWPLRYHGPTSGSGSKNKLPKVGPSVPFYVAIWTHVFPNHSINLHHSTVSLTSAAIKAGATVAGHMRDAGVFGVGSGPEVFEITVLKFPKLVDNRAFTAALSGATTHTIAPDPSQVCMNAVVQRGIKQIPNDGSLSPGDPNSPLFLAYFQWAITSGVDPNHSTGSGATVFTAHYDAAAGFKTQYGHNPLTVKQNFLFTSDGHGGYTTAFGPCGGTRQQLEDGFDMRVKIWPQKDHIVRTSVVDWQNRFHEFDAVVVPDPTLYPALDPNYGGNKTFLYYIETSDLHGGDLNNGSYGFNIVSQPYTTKAPKTNVFMAYPSNLSGNLYGPPEFRLMGSPYVGTPAKSGFWDDAFKWGAPPPVSSR